MSMYTNYTHFYDIAEYADKNWECQFSEREKAEVAHDLWFEHYLYNINLGNGIDFKISEHLIQVYRNLLEDANNNSMRASELADFLEMSVPGIDNYRN